MELTGSEDPATFLPESYDYRKAGRAPAVKNQGSLGTCWAFASVMALESRVRPEWNVSFSEDHMSLRNSFHFSQNAGGEYTMSMAYLLAWQGPVLEEEDPYGDGYSPDGLSPACHVQEIQVLPEKDYEAVKRAVYLYGGVQSSLYTAMVSDRDDTHYYRKETGAYWYNGDEKPNHDVVIIGWDDHYSRDNFNQPPEGDGAFICANSWGGEFGDDGYFTCPTMIQILESTTFSIPESSRQIITTTFTRQICAAGSGSSVTEKNRHFCQYLYGRGERRAGGSRLLCNRGKYIVSGIYRDGRRGQLPVRAAQKGGFRGGCERRILYGFAG